MIKGSGKMKGTWNSFSVEIETIDYLIIAL